MEGGVDIVRPGLGRSDRDAPATQRPQEPEGDAGLAGARMRARRSSARSSPGPGPRIGNRTLSAGHRPAYKAPMGFNLGDDRTDESRDKGESLRRGWTTGACATAATKAALTALVTGDFPDPVTITLPQGRDAGLRAEPHRTAPATAPWRRSSRMPATIPTSPICAEIVATLRFGAPGSGIVFRAGPGVGTVTREGLPHRGRRTGDQSGAAADDARRRRGALRRTRPVGGCRDHPVGHRWRGAGGQDLEPAPRHSRRPVDPRHDRHRPPLLLLGLDPLHPSRHRRGAGGRARPCRRRHRLGQRGCGAGAASGAAGDRLSRHGRLRRRPAQISARPSGARASPSPAASPS